MSLLVSSCRMSSSSSKSVVEFSMATYLLEMEKRLQAAQTISEQRMVDSQKQQIYKIVFLGASVGFTAFTIFEIGMRVFGYGVIKLG